MVYLGVNIFQTHGSDSHVQRPAHSLRASQCDSNLTKKATADATRFKIKLQIVIDLHYVYGILFHATSIVHLRRFSNNSQHQKWR